MISVVGCLLGLLKMFGLVFFAWWFLAELD